MKLFYLIDDDNVNIFYDGNTGKLFILLLLLLLTLRFVYIIGVLLLLILFIKLILGDCGCWVGL
jgi:hypothetical protein